MPASLKSIAYSFIEGFPQPYAFDAVVVEDGKFLVDVHQKFSNREDFLEAIQEVIPILTETVDKEVKV